MSTFHCLTPSTPQFSAFEELQPLPINVKNIQLTPSDDGLTFHAKSAISVTDPVTRREKKFQLVYDDIKLIDGSLEKTEDYVREKILHANENLQAVWADNSFSNASLPETNSFFQIDAQNILVSTVKKAEDSDDIVIRLTELEGKDKTVNFTSFREIKQAKLTNLIEDEIKSLKTKKNQFSFDLGHHSIETFKLK